MKRIFLILIVLLGVFAFGELYPLYETFYNSSSLGPIKAFDSLSISGGWFAMILITVAVGAFAVTTLIERRTNAAAPSKEFRLGPHRLAAAGVLVLGMILLILPERKAHMISVVSNPSYVAAHSLKTMTADELAFRIVDKESNIQIVDVRSSDEYGQLALPGSQNIPMRDFFSKDWTSLFSQRHVKKVLVADDEPQARSACLLLQKLGYENLAVLEGGLHQFKHMILDDTPFVPTGSRWDNDVKNFRETARAEINQMIETNKNVAPKVAKEKKKIKGGC